MKDKITCNNIDVATVTETGYKLFSDAEVEESLHLLDSLVCCRKHVILSGCASSADLLTVSFPPLLAANAPVVIAASVAPSAVWLDMLPNPRLLSQSHFRADGACGDDDDDGSGLIALDGNPPESTLNAATESDLNIVGLLQHSRLERFSLFLVSCNGRMKHLRGVRRVLGQFLLTLSNQLSITPPTKAHRQRIFQHLHCIVPLLPPFHLAFIERLAISSSLHGICLRIPRNVRQFRWFQLPNWGLVALLNLLQLILKLFLLNVTMQ